jgi:hypothetical protein
MVSSVHWHAEEEEKKERGENVWKGKEKSERS